MTDNFFIDCVSEFLKFTASMVDYDFFVGYLAVLVVFCTVALITKFTVGDYKG